MSIHITDSSELMKDKIYHEDFTVEHVISLQKLYLISSNKVHHVLNHYISKIKINPYWNSLLWA